MEGFEDPFNRQTYPWGKEDRELLDWYRALGALRKEHTALRRGDIQYLLGEGPLLAFTRVDEKESLLCAFNNSEEPQILDLGHFHDPLEQLLGRGNVTVTEDGTSMVIPPQSGVIFQVK